MGVLLGFYDWLGYLWNVFILGCTSWAMSEYKSKIRRGITVWVYLERRGVDRKNVKEDC